MLMTGITEAFDPDQLQRIFDTNASSWLRVNRAVLPVMRRQGHGTLVYTGSTTAHITEPFLGPYAAAKAAGDVLAEVIGMAVRAFGIDRSDEHTSELQSLMRSAYAVFCLKRKT